MPQSVKRENIEDESTESLIGRVRNQIEVISKIATRCPRLLDGTQYLDMSKYFTEHFLADIKTTCQRLEDMVEPPEDRMARLAREKKNEKRRFRAEQEKRDLIDLRFVGDEPF